MEKAKVKNKATFVPSIGEPGENAEILRFEHDSQLSGANSAVSEI
jgi:hypothetical protein